MVLVKKVIRKSKKSLDSDLTQKGAKVKKSPESNKTLNQDNLETVKIKKVLRSSLTHSSTNISSNMKRSSQRRKEERLAIEEAKRQKYNDSLNKIRVTWVNTEEKEEEIVEKSIKGKEIASIISALNRDQITLEPELIPLLDVDHFDDAIEIYENNQQYWMNKLPDKKALDSLIELEQWFILILEPIPETDNQEEIDYWKEKELYKKEHWQSIYCAPELRELVKVDDKKIQRKLLKIFKEFDIC